LLPPFLYIICHTVQYVKRPNKAKIIEKMEKNESDSQ
jgi:hypothetical protein